MPSHSTTVASVIARDLTIERGDRLVLGGVGVTVTTDSRLAVVGPNGVGKSTLLRILAGELEPDQGTVRRSPTGTTIGLVHQELDRGAVSVRQHVAAATGVAAAETAFAAATQALSRGDHEAEEEYDAALGAWTRLGAADFEARLGSVAEDVGLPARVLDLAPTALSGGQAARVGLLTVMLSRFDITLLDEPTNDLDLDGLALLERWVTGSDGGLVVVSHDRAFLERTITSVLELDEHRHTGHLFSGGWQSFIEERRRQRSLQEQRHADYVTERDRLRSRAQQQREWAQQGASRATRRPADGDKFRRAYNLAQTEKLVGKARATQRAIERLEVVEKPWEGWQLRFTIDEAPRSATIVAALDAAVLERGDWTVGPLDLEIRWAERVVLTGANGTGKSSVIAALLGRLEPVAGTATLGAGVIVGELDQGRHRFTDPERNLLEVFQDLTGQAQAEARSVLAKFGLDTDAIGRSPGSLSPGERTRAQMAHFQAMGVNFLVLDEPTNHLDLEAIEQLESALESYDGTLLLVSHDRRMLESLRVTRSVGVADLQQAQSP